MTKKERLLELFKKKNYLSSEINKLKSKLEAYKDVSISSSITDGIRVNNNTVSSPTERVALKIIETVKRIKDTHIEKINVIFEIEEIIENSLEEELEKTVLVSRLLEGATLKTIGKRLCYSRQNVDRIFHKALGNLENIEHSDLNN